MLQNSIIQKKNIIKSIIGFIVCFCTLLVIGTFYDLQIDQILTRTALVPGIFTSNDIFGASFEIIGDSPIYFMLSFAFSIIFIYVDRFFTGTKQLILKIFSYIANFVSIFAFIFSFMDYVIPHLIYNQSDVTLHKGPYLYVVYCFIAILGSCLSILATNNFSDKSIKNLLTFSIAVIIIALAQSILINIGIKTIVGRIRYRAMNLHPDDPNYGFAAFAKWYEVKGQWIPHDKMKEIFGTTDALKSFPSGHTASAGVIYGLTMLIDALKIEDKKKRILLWVLPISFTGIVAVSRMVVGAHFMTDVLFGGTMSFLLMILCREIFVVKGANIKVLFNKIK